MEELDITLRQALAAQRGDWTRIAAAADVSHSWLSKFCNGHIQNPGYATLKRLQICLFPVADAAPPVPAEEVSDAG